MRLGLGKEAWCKPCNPGAPVHDGEWAFWILGGLGLWVIYAQGAVLLVTVGAVLTVMVGSIFLGIE